jgi:hypothetical protein
VAPFAEERRECAQAARRQERLRNEIVGAEIQGFDFVLLGPAAGDDDDRQVGKLPEHSKEFASVEVGKPRSISTASNCSVLKALIASMPGRDGTAFEAAIRQRRLQHELESRIIFDHKETGSHLKRRLQRADQHASRLSISAAMKTSAPA